MTNRQLPTSATVLAAALVALGACKPDRGGEEPILDDSYQPAEDGVIYAMSGTELDLLGKGGRLTMQSLQGTVNRQEPRIFLAIDSGESHDSDWLEYLSHNSDMGTAPEQDGLWYLWAFQDQYDGYILFQNTNRESANVAMSLAGILNAVVVDQLSQTELKLMDEELGIPQLEDVRTWTEADLITSEYWPQFNNGMVMQEPFSGPETAPRDFGVTRGLPFFFDDPRDDASLPHYNHAWAQTSGDVYGWAYVDDDHSQDLFVEPLTAAGRTLTPTDKANNLSVYQHFSLDADLAQIGMPELPEDLEDKHVIAFVMSDGDQLGAVMGRMTNPEVGNFSPTSSYPTGWTLSPSVLDLAPPVAESIYNDATDDDFMVLAASGPALLYPSQWPDLEAWTEETVAAAAALDTTIVQVLDDPDTFGDETLDALANEPSIGAVFFAPTTEVMDTSSFHWVGDTPIIPMRKLGFDNDLEKTADIIDEWSEDLIEIVDTDLTSGTGYTLVYANLWKTRLTDFEGIEDELEGLVEELELDFDFEFVRPDQLVAIAKQHSVPTK